jgi:hypothetical protein
MGPVSSTGRAMMASLQQAMSKGMPVDQAIAYVKSMATQGVAPLTDLYVMLNQFQRLKQPPARPPMGSTIRDQITQESIGRAAQQGMSQGVAGLDAGVMERAQYAGGGIVAFQEGGLTVGDQINQLEEALKTDDYLKSGAGYGGIIGKAIERGAVPMGYVQRLETERKLQQLKSTQSQMTPTGSGGPSTRGRYKPDTDEVTVAATAPKKEQVAPPPPRRDITPAERRMVSAAAPIASASAAPAQDRPSDIRSYLSDIEKLQKERGIGAATDKAMQLLAQEEAEFKTQAQKDRSLALAQAGFRMARAASKPGATFMAALGEGGEEYVRGVQDISKSTRDFQRNLNRERINLERSKELLAAGNIEAAVKLRESSLDRIEKEKDRQSRTALTMFTARLDQEGRLATVDAQDRATLARLLGDASTAYTNGLATLQTSPDYMDADEAGKAKMRQQLEDMTYNRMVSGVFGGGAREDLPYGEVLKFNPQTNKVE